MILEPTCTVYVQKAATIGQTINPNQPYTLRLLGPSSTRKGGFPFTIIVEEGTSEARGLATARIHIPQLTRNEVDVLPAGSLVRIDAGYEPSHPNVPGERPIFFGVLGTPKPRPEGGALIFDFPAVSQPNRLFNAKVAYTAAEQKIGDIIIAMARILKLPDPILPPEFFGAEATYTPDGPILATTGIPLSLANPALAEQVTMGTGPNPWTSTKTFIQDVADLIVRCGNLTGKAFGMVPNSADPFQIKVADMAGDPKEILTIDLDNPVIIDAYPIYDEGQPQFTPTFTGDEATDQDPLEFQSSKTYVKRFFISQAFDPRIHTGLFAKFESEEYGDGAFVVDEVTHTIEPSAPWTTVYSGNFIAGDYLVAAPTVTGTEGEEATSPAS